MHADRALGLAAAAKQIAQGEVQFDRLRIDLHHFDESLDRLVRLLIEQEIEALEIRARQGARFRHQVFDVDARREPAQSEEQRECEQPPEFEFHADTLEFGRRADVQVGSRRAGFARAAAQFALQPRDLAPLPEHRGQRGEHP